MGEKKAKDKAAFSGMFSGKSMYDDREKEMEDRLRRKKEEEDKELDEYSRSKIDRRSEGKEELTFEEWKKEKEKARANAAPTDDSLYKPSSNKKEKKDKVELDEVDEHTKSLIGNIAPKRIDPSGSLGINSPSSPAVISRNDSTASTNSNNSSGAGASVWNTAGTWEERDMSSDVKSRLTELCNGVYTESAKIKDVKSIEGDAQIVMARGKKRHIYDYNIKLEFEVSIVESVSKEGEEGGEEEKTSKYKGTFVFPEVSPICSYDCQVSFKKSVPSNVKTAVNGATEELKNFVISTLRAFDHEYKAM